MVAGAVLAPVLIRWTSLRISLAFLGLAAVLIVILCRAALVGLDALSRQRADFLASRVAVIEQLPLAAGASRAVLEQLASASQICPLPPGVDVVVEGAPAHAFYAVIEGRVVVHRDGQEVTHLGPGDYFGERGLLDNAPRNATVTTEEQSTVLRLEGSVLLEALQSAPTVLSAIDRPSGQARTSGLPGESTALVDDPKWVGA